MYADYDYYVSNRAGEVPALDDTEFKHYSEKAGNYLELVTNELVTDVDVLDLMLDKLKTAEVAIIDLLYRFDREDEQQSTNKSNETQDGYSVNYRSPEDKAKERNARLKDITRMYLTAPINLIYGGR